MWKQSPFKLVLEAKGASAKNREALNRELHPKETSMTYQIDPEIIRLIPFKLEGGALAAVEIAFGPILVSTKLYKTASGFFLSLPSRKSEAHDRWYEQVTITDPALKAKAQTKAVLEFEKVSRGELVAI